MNRIRTIIVDDEKKARDGLKDLLKANNEIDLMACCQNGLEAIDFLKKNHVELAFLDIQMPGINGFEVLNSIDVTQRPVVVFVTAFDQFALKAFDYHAIDYLLKPFTNQRFSEALLIAKKSIEGQDISKVKQKIDKLLQSTNSQNSTSLVSTDEKYGARLVIKSDGKIMFIEYQAIEWVEAYDYYIKIHTVQKTYLVRESMKVIELKLAQKKFVRIHKSTLINTDYLKELAPSGHGEFMATLKSNVQLKVSRHYKGNISYLIKGLT